MPATAPAKPLPLAKAASLKKPLIAVIEPREGLVIGPGEEFAVAGTITSDNGAIIPSVVRFRIVGPRGRECASGLPDDSGRDIGGRVTVKGMLRAPEKAGDYSIQIRASDDEWTRVVQADPKSKESDEVALSPKVKIKVQAHAQNDGRG